VSPAGWAGLAKAAERTAREMKPQEVSNSFNALSKLEAAAAAVSPAGWAGLAMAAERTAREMNPQNVANTLNALPKLHAVEAVVSPAGWAGLAEAAERTANLMNEIGFQLGKSVLFELARSGASVEFGSSRSTVVCGDFVSRIGKIAVHTGHVVCSFNHSCRHSL